MARVFKQIELDWQPEVVEAALILTSAEGANSHGS